MARGQPKRPAAVSGPSALSKRTDGGAGSKTQPLRAPTGQPYGERQALEAQQKAAPLAVGGGGTANPPSPTPSGPIGGIGPAFGPTQRPGESPLAGMGGSGQFLAQNVDEFLRVLYSQFPHPYLAMLLRRDT